MSRYYPNLPNEFGGIGVHKPADDDGMIFKDSDDAEAHAIKKGYVQKYFTSPELRARRIERAKQMKEEIGQLLTQLANNQFDDAEQTFNYLAAQKVANRLEDMKQEVGSSFMNQNKE